MHLNVTWDNWCFRAITYREKVVASAVHRSLEVGWGGEGGAIDPVRVLTTAFFVCMSFVYLYLTLSGIQFFLGLLHLRF